eukprot:COSAG06_NODE_5804_length_3262_cov_2.306161_1_plen_44_part_10
MKKGRFSKGAPPPLNELGVDRENTRGNLHFLSAFRARKVPLLVG